MQQMETQLDAKAVTCSLPRDALLLHDDSVLELPFPHPLASEEQNTLLYTEL